eukprot:3619437-Pyramimonas_sp.AAC.1
MAETTCPCRTTVGSVPRKCYVLHSFRMVRASRKHKPTSQRNLIRRCLWTAVACFLTLRVYTSAVACYPLLKVYASFYLTSPQDVASQTGRCCINDVVPPQPKAPPEETLEEEEEDEQEQEQEQEQEDVEEEDGPLDSTMSIDVSVARNGSSTKLAIVMPVRMDGGSEIWTRVTHHLAQWEMYQPCSRPLHNQVKFVFMYGRPGDAAREGQTEFNIKLLLNLWKQSASATYCFGLDPELISVPLTPKQNRHPDCTCVLFYETFGRLRRLGYHHWFQMETDVMPVQH